MKRGKLLWVFFRKARARWIFTLIFGLTVSLHKFLYLHLQRHPASALFQICSEHRMVPSVNVFFGCKVAAEWNSRQPAGLEGKPSKRETEWRQFAERNVACTLVQNMLPLVVSHKCIAKLSTLVLRKFCCTGMFSHCCNKQSFFVTWFSSKCSINCTADWLNGFRYGYYDDCKYQSQE